MNVPASLFVAALSVAAAASTALAAPMTVWRCGPDGRSYSDVPCADGRSLDASDPRNAADVAAARQRGARERDLAAAMKRERERREAAAAAAHARPVSLSDSPPALVRPAPKKVAKKRAPLQPADDGIWRAVVPVSPRKPG